MHAKPRVNAFIFQACPTRFAFCVEPAQPRFRLAENRNIDRKCRTPLSCNATEISRIMVGIRSRGRSGEDSAALCTVVNPRPETPPCLRRVFHGAEGGPPCRRRALGRPPAWPGGRFCACRRRPRPGSRSQAGSAHGTIDAHRAFRFQSPDRGAHLDIPDRACTGPVSGRDRMPARRPNLVGRRASGGREGGSDGLH